MTISTPSTNESNTDTLAEARRAWRAAAQAVGAHVENRARRKEAAQAFVAEVNARTFCAHCGAQPIEWHNPEHVDLNRQSFRISSLVVQGRSIDVIQAEMGRCTPLCRRCHMREDGRLRALVESGRTSREARTAPIGPCVVCGRVPRRIVKSMCLSCYYQQPEQRRRRQARTAARRARGAEYGRVDAAERDAWDAFEAARVREGQA